MKFLTTCILFSFCALVHADDQANKFDQVKQQRLSNIEKRLSYVSELKTCIAASTEWTSMKACDDAHTQKMKELMESNQNFKQNMKEERKSRRGKKK